MPTISFLTSFCRSLTFLFCVFASQLQVSLSKQHLAFFSNLSILTPSFIFQVSAAVKDLILPFHSSSSSSSSAFRLFKTTSKITALQDLSFQCYQQLRTRNNLKLTSAPLLTSLFSPLGNSTFAPPPLENSGCFSALCANMLPVHLAFIYQRGSYQNSCFTPSRSITT